jgi:hypothetical protein
MALWEKRELANDVRTVEFVQAVAWCREPEVKAALVSVFQRTGDPDLLLATLPALDQAQWPLIRERLSAGLRAQPKDEGGWYGDGYHILSPSARWEATRQNRSTTSTSMGAVSSDAARCAKR